MEKRPKDEADEHNSQPKVDPKPGLRLTDSPSKLDREYCFRGRMEANKPQNFEMEPFTWLGEPARRATGGIVCATRTTKESGERATPAGHPLDGNLNGTKVERGHLIAASLHGSNLVDNIVTQYRTVDRSDVKIIEMAVARVLDNNPGVSVLYKVRVQYASPTAAMPAWIHIDAVGSNGFTCLAEIQNLPSGNETKTRC